MANKLTVYFADSFWQGIYERDEQNHLVVAKIVFGAEPTENEVYAYLLKNSDKLVFSPPVSVEASALAPEVKNPKRRQREISRSMQVSGIGTKAQQALSLAREQKAQVRKTKRHQNRAEQKEAHFLTRQKKKKEKLRGH